MVCRHQTITQTIIFWLFEVCTSEGRAMLESALPSASELERKFKFAQARAERCLNRLCRAQANSNASSSLQAGTRCSDCIESQFIWVFPRRERHIPLGDMNVASTTTVSCATSACIIRLICYRRKSAFSVVPSIPMRGRAACHRGTPCDSKQNTMFFLVFSNEGIFDIVKEKAV